jgi:hypothetical protein
VRLFEGVAGVSEVVPAGMPLPPFDVHLPLMSVPAVLGVGQNDLARSVPYLRAKDADAAGWRNRVTGGEGARVGLAWASRPGAKLAARKDFSLRQLDAVLRVPGVSFHSLQLGPAAREIEQRPSGTITDLSGHISDFADTAGAIACMDLVITIDTAVAHLAGAMGKPVWTLLLDVDWRWMLDRQDSPWYPTMRLFRGKGNGDRQGVVEQVAAALAVARASRP